MKLSQSVSEFLNEQLFHTEIYKGDYSVQM